MNLIGLCREELTREIELLDEKPFRAKQLWHWIYHQGETDFDKMTSLGKSLRTKLKEKHTLSRPEIVKELTSTDTTRKWLLRFDDGQTVESVYIPEEDRGAVCISTQVGCPNKCAFCHTGTQKLTRNLTAGEIVSQFLVARDSYAEWPSPCGEQRLLSNVVVMGMGEPLLNYDALKTALKILTDNEGIGVSKRRITVSTSGIVPKIPQLAKDFGCIKLAVSLHAPTDEIRNKIMPVNKKYPLTELMNACREFQEIAGTRQYITMEYVMLDGINDSDSDARALLKLVDGLMVKFNLIPFNEWQGCSLKCSSEKRIARFSSLLEKAHFAAPVRASRGQDIMAACGQLKSMNGVSGV